MMVSRFTRCIAAGWRRIARAIFVSGPQGDKLNFLLAVLLQRFHQLKHCVARGHA